MTTAAEGDLSDAEWAAEVRKYAVNFGRYDFSRDEIERMRPYVQHLPPLPGVKTWSTNLSITFNLMDEMERGLIAAVTRRLTQ